MIKKILKRITSGPCLVSLLLPIALNLLALLCGLSFFGSYGGVPKVFAEGLTNTVFYFANWPSILFRTFPHRVGQNGEVIYELLDLLNLKVFIANALGWGLLALVGITILEKYRRQMKRPEKS